MRRPRSSHVGLCASISLLLISTRSDRNTGTRQCLAVAAPRPIVSPGRNMCFTHSHSHRHIRHVSMALSLRGGESKATNIATEEGISSPSGTSAFPSPRHRFPRLKMWETCILAVVIWMTIGTIFYHRTNNWPLATAFFYAVDAGMSIGFCTDVSEKTVKSRAFSILFILLGASVVGGALALFVADLLEGASRTITYEYRSMIENDAFTKNDRNKDGYLTFVETKHLLCKGGYVLPEEQLQYICEGLDKDGDKRISYKEFQGVFRKTDLLLSGVDIFRRRSWIRRILPDSSSLEEGKYLMYIVFFGWMAMGVSWGMINQKWDPITSTHFAVSALATGGLTAPPVNEDGFLPTDVAIFVGVFSLLGVPLFYLALGHSAKLLIQSHLTDAEQRIIRTKLKPYEYSIATHLISSHDDYIHLSDFIVLQFLRRGLTDVNTIKLVKKQFEALDTNGDGALTFEEATGASDQA